jgi:dipeptidyl aminopeptidase/acylaminoacyl peptidase
MCLKAHIFLFFLFLSTAVATEDCELQTHPFSVHDMLAMDRISDPQVSPDGRMIVFVVRETDLEANRGRTDLWVVGVDGAGLRRLTSHPENDSNPRWGPDSKSVWFLSKRSGSSQVWRIAIDGGEAEQFTEQPLDVGNLVVSPEGKYIGFTIEVFPDCNTVCEVKERLEKLKERKASGRIYERLFVRHWDIWKDGRRSHLFVMASEGDGAVDVMRGMDADTPSKPFGGPEEITFAPDGTGVIFSARDAGRAEAWSTDFDLYWACIDGSEQAKCLTEKNKAWDTLPVFSPDGRTVAYLAMARPGYESDRFRIVLRSWPEGKERILTEGWDRSPSLLCWSGDGRALYATAANLGQKSLFAIDVKTGKVRTLLKEGYVHSLSVGGDRVVYGLSNLRSPVELYSVESGGGRRRITGINSEKITRSRMGEYEQFSFRGWKDETVYGYVVKPVDFDSSKKYPVAFLIHGGPQGAFSNSFHYRWNPQVYAGAGYGVVMVDFHGSTGYGQDFTDSIRGDWGGKPLEDLKRGLAAALERYRWMDGRRVAALGASFGGYMVNWIAGKWPEGFCCLVNHDGSLDERMAYFDTDELWFPEWDHMGTPWENAAGYQEHNPIDLVQNWRTPMLVIHGALDFRVPETQGLSTFAALQRLGIESRLLYFADENHWVLKPHNSILWHDTVLGWLDRWLKR